MKICITSSGDNLESQIDPRFGRCRYFIIWDEATDTFKAITNPNIDAGSGAGINSAQLVVSEKVQMVLTGEVGPKAEKVLNDAKLQIITGLDETMTVKEAIEKYKAKGNDSTNIIANKQNPTNTKTKSGVLERCAQKFLGLGPRPMRGGGGCGNGMGRGRGRGMGRSKKINGNFLQGKDEFCICPICGEKQQHRLGIPCRSVTCPKCGSIMVRE